MKSDIEEGLRILREAAEQAKELRIELTDDYLAMIAYLEALPENQAGAHKVDPWRGMRLYIESFGRAVLLPRRS